MQWIIPQTLPEALRLAAEQAGQVVILTIENKQKQEQILSLESLFRQGMTIPQFCKMLNGVNVMRVAERLEERNWLYNESRSGNSKRWRVASYARDRYLTEEQQQIGIHGYELFIKFTPVLLQAGGCYAPVSALCEKRAPDEEGLGWHVHTRQSHQGGRMSKEQALKLELKAVHASLSEVNDMLFAIKTADDNSKGLKEVVEEIVSNIQWDIEKVLESGGL